MSRQHRDRERPEATLDALFRLAAEAQRATGTASDVAPDGAADPAAPLDPNIARRAIRLITGAYDMFEMPPGEPWDAESLAVVQALLPHATRQA